MIYRALFNLVFSKLDPEEVHVRAVRALSLAGNCALTRCAMRLAFGRRVEPPLTRDHLNHRSPFARPVPGILGLAAGMDKDATAVLGMDALGFGFVEVGTFTALAQPGNEKPRLFRLVEERGIINRMGFNNHGAAAAGERLRRLRQTKVGRAVFVGANIGKSKVTPLEDAVADYVTSARHVARWADYLVVNVSSPNTPGLRDLQNVESLRPILAAVQESANDAAGRHVPLFVKIAPDLAPEDLVAVAKLVNELDLAGVVATNTTIDHPQEFGPGGLSGAPLTEKSLAVVRALRAALGEEKTIIGVGGITTVAQAERMLDAGANYLQAYSAFIYEGPAWPGRLNRALARRGYQG
ncbi:MAG: quinone-dependent dihydroorotate dehydrogenase [Buchananella hordeovulneris]|nr:quinone-dependent dihydroorotate dehydrogenase [Buchananella hordeovulneris]